MALADVAGADNDVFTRKERTGTWMSRIVDPRAVPSVIPL
jgi:hypothetical protein